MNAEQFDQIRENLFKRCKEITDKKGKDYTKGSIDVLLNFKQGGSELGIPPIKTLGIFMKKHVDAIYHYIKTEGAHESEPIEERIADALNYLVFLKCLIDEKVV